MTTGTSLCSNSHREIPVINTGSLQWEQGFPVMKTGFSLWELVHRENPVLALYWHCTGLQCTYNTINCRWERSKTCPELFLGFWFRGFSNNNRLSLSLFVPFSDPPNFQTFLRSGLLRIWQNQPGVDPIGSTRVSWQKTACSTSKVTTLTLYGGYKSTLLQFAKI